LDIASGLRSHSLVEPSTSVKRNVIVPVGSPVIDFGPDSPGALIAWENYGLSSFPYVEVM
jgi:hypothetical protein